MGQTRAVVDRNDAGYGDPPLVPGGHRARRSTEPEACHQRWGDAAASSRRGAAAGAYPAAHRGADDRRLAVRPDPRRSCAAGGGSRVGILSPPDLPVAEQVIDVPMISSSSCPFRAVLNEPQVVEQLVEVPTILSPAEEYCLSSAQILTSRYQSIDDDRMKIKRTSNVVNMLEESTLNYHIVL